MSNYSFSLLWDRKSLLQIFDFDYIWEAYKPAEQRKWGYYVLPSSLVINSLAGSFAIREKYLDNFTLVLGG
jgi:hypothetical protein